MFLTYRTWWPWLCVTCEVRVGLTGQLPSDSADLPLEPGRHVMRKPRPRVELQLPVPGGCDDRLMASAATLGSPRAFGEFQPLSSASTSLQIQKQSKWWWYFKPVSYGVVCSTAVDNQTNNNSFVLPFGCGTILWRFNRLCILFYVCILFYNLISQLFRTFY